MIRFFGIVLLAVAAVVNCNKFAEASNPFQSCSSCMKERTVTTIVNATSAAEATVKAQKRYPNGKVISVRKSGNVHWTVKLKLP